jgi:hypothetical protein
VEVAELRERAAEAAEPLGAGPAEVDAEAEVVYPSGEGHGGRGLRFA